MPDKTKIARSIVELRAATGLRQAAFARCLRTSSTSIGHFEAGSRRPGPGSPVKLTQTALATQRRDLAEVFAGALPGIQESWLVFGWSAANGASGKSFDYPRMLFHQAKPPLIVESAAEEKALEPEWSRTVIW